MNKLEHEEDLRSIIESKLKGTEAIDIVRDSQQILLNETNDEQVALKLRQCQNEIKQFKEIIK